MPTTLLLILTTLLLHLSTAKPTANVAIDVQTPLPLTASLHTLTLPHNTFHCNSTDSDYFGTRDFASSGRACVGWPREEVERFPLAALEAGPYCRNPDGSPHAFCYTDATTREFCNVTDSFKEGPDLLRMYSANATKSSFGLTCRAYSGAPAHCHYDEGSNQIGCYVLRSSYVFEACNENLCCQDTSTCETQTTFVGNVSLGSRFISLILPSWSGFFRLSFSAADSQPTSAVAVVVTDTDNTVLATTKFDRKFVDYTNKALDCITLTTTTEAKLYRIFDCDWRLINFVEGKLSSFVICSSQLQASGGFRMDTSGGGWSAVTPWGSYSHLVPPTSLCPATQNYEVLSERIFADGVYVSPLGNDTNFGLSASEPVATLSRAMNVLQTFNGLTENRVFLLAGTHTLRMSDAFSSVPENTCYQLNLMDAGNYRSWNGAELSFQTCDSHVIPTTTLALQNGEKNQTKYICIDTPQRFQVVVTPGDFPDAVQWTLASVDHRQNDVLTLLHVGTGDQVYTHTCCALDDAKLTLIDRFGDGWTHTHITVTSCDGSVVVLPPTALRQRYNDTLCLSTQVLSKGFRVFVEQTVDQFSGHIEAADEIRWSLVLPTQVALFNLEGLGSFDVGCGINNGTGNQLSLSEFEFYFSSNPSPSGWLGSEAIVANCDGSEVFSGTLSTDLSKKVKFSADLSEGVAVIVTEGYSPFYNSWQLRAVSESASAVGSTVNLASGVAPAAHITCPSRCGSDPDLFMFAVIGPQSLQGVVAVLKACGTNHVVANITALGANDYFSFSCFNRTLLDEGYSVEFTNTGYAGWFIAQHNRTVLAGQTSSSSCASACPNPRSGDGICDSDLNVSPCWDSGDCCATTCMTKGCTTATKDCRARKFEFVGVGDVKLVPKGAFWGTSAFAARAGDELTLRNLNMSNFNINGYSLVLSTLQASVKVVNCTFDNVTSTAATVSTNGSVAWVQNSRFSSCKSLFAGGAMIGRSYGLLRVENVEFNNDTAMVAGGSLALSGLGNTLLCYKCNSTNDSARLYGGFASTEGTQGISRLAFSASHVFNASATVGGAIMNNAAAKLVLVSSTLDSSMATSYGGAIFSGEAFALNITNCTISNSRGWHGGAIFCTQGVTSARMKMFVTNSKFRNNTSSGSGGVLTSFCAVSMQDSELVGNNATKHGGALYISTVDEDDIVDTVTGIIANNSAGQDGGAIYIKYPKIGAIYLGALFENNTANGLGGALYSLQADITSESVMFLSNTAQNGGAAYLSKSTLDVASLVAKGNTATSNGGALFLEADSLSTVDAETALFSHNTAQSSGGVAYIAASNIFKLDAAEINNNQATEYGGALYTEDAEISMQNTVVANNQAVAGGAIFSSASTVEFSNVTVSTCSAAIGGALYLSYAQLSCIDSVFENNDASTYGGAMYLSGSADGSVIEQTTFSANLATLDGGAIFALGVDLSIHNNSFEFNEAKSGGAIGAVQSNFQRFDHNVFRQNAATVNGGGVYLVSLFAIMEQNQFINNTALLGGGLAFMQGTNQQSFIVGNSFIGNSASSGGAFISSDSILGVERCRFTSNIAFSCGAWLSTHDELELTSNYFLSNEGGDQGGALCCSQTVGMLAINTTFERNNAVTGGAVFLDEAISNDPVSFETCSFRNNYAQAVSGAIHSNVVTKMDSSNFIGNSAPAAGAISLLAESTEIELCNFDGNSATSGSAGALLVASSSASSYITQTTFQNNHAEAAAGAVLFVQRTVQLSGCSFTNNSAGTDGGALVLELSRGSVVSQSVFANNTALGSGGAVAVMDSPSTNISSCSFSHNAAVQGRGGAVLVDKSTGSVVSEDTTFEMNVANSAPTLGSDATSLTVVNGITSAIAGSKFTGSIVVTFIDSNGAEVTTGSLGTVSVKQTSGGTLLGSTLVTVSNGAAEFDSLTMLTGCGSFHNLSVSSSFLPNATETVELFLDCKDDTVDNTALLVVSSVFCFFDFLVLYIVVMNRHSQVIKGASPPFCVIQITGDILLLVGVLNFATTPTSATCSLTLGFFMLGFTLAFGSLCLKTWRVVKIFANAQLTRVSLPNKFLFRWLGGLLAVDFILLLTQYITKHPNGETTILRASEKQYTDCNFHLRSVPFLLLSVSKVALLCWGVALSIAQSRALAAIAGDLQKRFDDSREVGYCLNNTFVILVAEIPLYVALQDDQWKIKRMLLASAAIALSQFNALIIFMPKLRRLFEQATRGENTEHPLLILLRGNSISAKPRHATNAQ